MKTCLLCPEWIDERDGPLCYYDRKKTAGLLDTIATPDALAGIPRSSLLSDEEAEVIGMMRAIGAPEETIRAALLSRQIKDGATRPFRRGPGRTGQPRKLGVV